MITMLVIVKAIRSCRRTMTTTNTMLLTPPARPTSRELPLRVVVVEEEEGRPF